jgi:WD40 repeat protein
VGDDKALRVWDIRKCREALVVPNAHTSDIFSVEFNPAADYLIATASDVIHLWDIRRMAGPLFTFAEHVGDVRALGWAPWSEVILASASTDRRVMVWDLSRIGEEVVKEDRADGPPELLFTHGGHCDALNDFSWHPTTPWLCASTSEDNVLQVWKMSYDLYGDDSSEEGLDGVGDSDGGDVE